MLPRVMDFFLFLDIFALDFVVVISVGIDVSDAGIFLIRGQVVFRLGLPTLRQGRETRILWMVLSSKPES